MIIKQKSFYAGFFKLFGIIVLQNVIVLSVNLADNIMIGGYSEPALAGVAAVNQVQFVYHQLVLGIGDALVVLASQYWGQRRIKPVKRIANGAFFLAIVTGLLLFIACSLFPTQIITLFTPYPEIIEQGVMYLEIIKYSYLTFAFTSAMLAMMRSVEVVKIAFYISLSTLVINCGINYILIGGNFGAPEMGVRGAAIGTLTARIIEFIIALCYILVIDKRIKYRIKEDKYFLFDIFEFCFHRNKIDFYKIIRK